MAIDLKFDLVGNPETPTIILTNRNGNKLGQLQVDETSIDLNDKFNDASEFSFTLNKFVDGELTNLWDKVVDFKLVYCKEWDMYFEIKVELDEFTETVKTVFCTQLGQAELSQIKLYDIEINNEDDPNWDKTKVTDKDYSYKKTILFDENDTNASLLHRILDKAPHYSVIHVDGTIKNIQRTFSFDDISIYDAFMEIAEEIGCLFVFHSNADENGNIQRTISVYDLQQYCNSCEHRGKFTDECPECGSKNITYGYGEDTLIFVTSDELAASGIQLVTDADSVKNCFKLEAGDDLMTATVRNCNPNGTDYIWRFSNDIKEDMSGNLVKKLESYDELYNYYIDDYIVPFSTIISENSAITLVVGRDVHVGDILIFKCLSTNTLIASISYITSSGINHIVFDGVAYLVDEYGNRLTDELGNYLTEGGEEHSVIEFEIGNDVKEIKVNEYVGVYTKKDNEIVKEYNNLINKYKTYNKDLEEMPPTIIGYPNLMNVYYDVIDLGLYLKSSLMPSVEMSDTNAEEQVRLLTASSLSPIAVTNETTASLTTVNSAVLAMAKIIVKPTYKVHINNSELVENGSMKVWNGNFVVTNYSDENDMAISNVISIEVNGDLESFVKQKIEKALNKENTDDLSISGLFKKEYEKFCKELKKYALNPLIRFREACQACIDILIEQGVGSSDTWSDENAEAEGNLYDNLYVPYYKKLAAIEAEVKLREDEIGIVTGVYDLNGNLIKDGLQTIIEKCKKRIQNALDFENYLGKSLWLEFCAYRREDKYSNENYISDGLDNAELFEKALEFFRVAENEIFKASELQHSISTTLNNLLAIPKFKQLVKSFKVGNWIRVQVDDKIYKLRLLEYRIDYGNFENIDVEFSDVTKIKNGITDVKNILSQASSMASSYGAVQRQANQGEQSNNILNNWVENGLNTTNTKIITGSDGQSQVLDRHGILCREYDPITETYSDEQLKIINSTLAITDDNWENTKTAIGKYFYTDPVTKELKSVYGVNGETIVGKLFVGERLDIVNSNGSLEFGGSGLVVQNESNTVSINPNNESIFNISNNDGNIFSLNNEGELLVVGNIVASNLTLLDGTTIETENITGLSDVAISGSYNDLDDKPELSNVAISGSYNDLFDSPTKLSQFTNDSSFITKEVNNLTNYYKKSEIDSSIDSKANSEDLAEVATSGSYSDIVDIEEFKNWILEQIQSAISAQ